MLLPERGVDNLNSLENFCFLLESDVFECAVAEKKQFNLHSKQTNKTFWNILVAVQSNIPVYIIIC